MANHIQLGGGHVDNLGFVQATDPATGTDAGLVIANRCWVDTSVTPYRMKLRNANNNAWVDLSSATGEGGGRIKVVVSGSLLTTLVSDNGTDWYQINQINK